MLKHNILFFLILFIPVYTLSQSAKNFYLVDFNPQKLSAYDKQLIDSTLTSYHQTTADTLKLELLNNLIDNCYDDVWIKYNQLLQRKAKQIRNATTDSATYNKATYFYAVSLGNMAYIFDNQSNFDSATYYYEQALRFFTEANAPSGIGQIYNALAMINENRGNIRLSIENYQKAAELALQANDHFGLANTYNNLGRIHESTNSYKLAEHSYVEAYRSAILANDKRLQGYALFKIAHLEMFNGDTINALRNIRKGLELLDQINAQFYKLHGYIELGRYKREKNELDSAFYYYRKVFTLGESKKSTETEALALSRMAEIRTKQNLWNDALELANLALQKAEASETTDHQVYALELLSRIYEHKNNYKQAYKFLQQYSELNSLLINNENKNKAVKQYFEFEYDKQKAIDDIEYSKQLALKEQEKKQNRIVAISAIIFSIFIVLALAGLYNRYKFIQQKKEELRVAYLKLQDSKKNELLVSNLKALQSQMNPHFIFNALNSIQTLVLKGDIDQSYIYINKFADLVRKTLLFSEQENISITDEIALLEIYLNLEKLRFKEEFQYQITANNLPQINVPPMLIQPFVENALRHGLLHKKNNRKLSITLWFADVLYCEVTDNGIGRKAASEINQRRNKHQSFAIGATTKRFEMLQESFEQPIGFEYTDLYENNLPAGTKVVLRIPFKNTTHQK